MRMHDSFPEARQFIRPQFEQTANIIVLFRADLDQIFTA
jgi:hypothetical protein